MTALRRQLGVFVPGEVDVVECDYSARLGDGETITSAARTLTVISGADPAPGNVLAGAAQVQGPLVRQMLAASVAGTTYLLTILATTSNGRTLPCVCVVPVRNP